MAKFIYRLQGTLSLKEKLEEQKKMEYGHAIAKLESEKQRLLELEEEQNLCVDQFRTTVSKSINQLKVQQYNSYIKILKVRVKEQMKVIAVAEKNVEKKRTELMYAVQERKKLEKLREKAFEEYLSEEKIAEQKAVDEIVSYKYN